MSVFFKQNWILNVCLALDFVQDVISGMQAHRSTFVPLINRDVLKSLTNTHKCLLCFNILVSV